MKPTAPPPPIAAMAEQEHPPSQVQRVDEILEFLQTYMGSNHPEVVTSLRSHITLLRRQAAKAKNQRKTLKQLHRAHRAALLELRWLKSTIVGAVGTAKWRVILQETKSTLWNLFKKEAWQNQPQALVVNADKLKALLSESPEIMDRVSHIRVYSGGE